MFTEEIKGVSLTFSTAEKVFSPRGADEGTLAMLSATEFGAADKVLDLGCGYGIVGILVAKLIGGENVVMCDISEDAVRLAAQNAAANGVEGVKIFQSDGFSDFSEGNFTIILSNPPYHTDFSVAKGFIENGFKRLALGGKLVMVTKRLDWYKNKLTAVFGGVRVETAGEYYVFTAEKRAGGAKIPAKPRKTLSKKLQRKAERRLR